VRLPEGEWSDQLGGARVSGAARVGELLRHFPVALLAREPYGE
jgi:maltooligosyltrehalose synthase